MTGTSNGERDMRGPAEANAGNTSSLVWVDQVLVSFAGKKFGNPLVGFGELRGLPGSSTVCQAVETMRDDLIAFGFETSDLVVGF